MHGADATKQETPERLVEAARKAVEALGVYSKPMSSAHGRFQTLSDGCVMGGTWYCWKAKGHANTEAIRTPASRHQSDLPLLISNERKVGSNNRTDMLLQRGVDNGWWSVADLDRPSQGFRLATEHFSPEFGDSYTPSGLD